MTDKGFNKLNFSLPLSMDTAVPVDYNSYFKTYEDAVIAASNATSAGGKTSQYYIGQVLTVVNDTNKDVKYYVIKHDKTLEEVNLRFTFTDGLTSNSETAQNGNIQVGISEITKGKIDNTYLAVRTTSANWDNVYTGVKTLSGNWENARTEVETSSAYWDSVYTTIEETSGKWESGYASTEAATSKLDALYTTFEGSSGKWEENCSTLQSISSDWENTKFEVQSSSANYRSVYTTVLNASSNWNIAYSDASSIKSVTPEDVFEIEGNQLADKKYVQGIIESSILTFRGSFGIWDDVPINSSGYNEDIYGKRVPQQNDYIIVYDCSSLEYSVEVRENIVGETLTRNVVTEGGDILFFAGHVIEENDIVVLRNNNIQNVYIKRRGTWRFKFVGTWVDGGIGKSRWTAEYQINTTPFTNEQIAAINSGINQEYVSQIKKNRNNLNIVAAISGEWNLATSEIQSTSAETNNVNTVTETTSATWNTVSNKIDKSYFHYYTLNEWNILTNDDTDYSRVPEGMIYIYEDSSPTPTPTSEEYLSIFTNDDGVLTFAENISCVDGTLIFTSDSKYELTSGIFTTPGSSDYSSGSEFDLSAGRLTLSDDMTYANGVLTLGANATFSDVTGLLTLRGTKWGDENFVTVVNNLTNAVNSNNATRILKGSQYIAVISALPGYNLTTLTCTMNGATMPLYGETSYNITNVTGNIIITAVATAAPQSNFTVTNSLVNATNSNSLTSVVSGDPYVAILIPNEGYIMKSEYCTMGGIEQSIENNVISIPSVTANISIAASASIDDNNASYTTSNGILTLTRNSTFGTLDGILTFGENVSYNNSTKTLSMSGSKNEPRVTYNITNVLTHVVNSNTDTTVAVGGSYNAILSAMDGYVISSIDCRMGDYVITTTGNSINIPIVNNDITITAGASGHSSFNTSNGIMMLDGDSTYNTSTHSLTFGNSVGYSNVTGTMTLN